MISVIIPTYNAAPHIGPCLASLVQGAVAGHVRELIISDGGSGDDIAAIAEGSGAVFLSGEKGRGGQLARGAQKARGPWLLFIHADTILAEGWADCAAQFIAAAHKDQVACFSFALADPDPRARRVEKWVRRRIKWLGLPYGDQAVLIHETAYRRLGGYPDIPLMEDVALMRKIKKRDLTVLPIAARTSAERYRRDGYWHRPLKNLLLLGCYFCGMSPERIARFYG